MMMTTSTDDSWTSFEETNANSGIEGIQCVLFPNRGFEASGPCGAVIVYGIEKLENLPRFVNL